MQHQSILALSVAFVFCALLVGGAQSQCDVMVIVFPNQQCRNMSQCVSAQLDATNCIGFFMDAGVNYWAQANCTTKVVSFFSNSGCTNLDTTIDSKNNNKCASLGSGGHSATVAFDTNGCSSAGSLQSWMAFLL